MSTEELNAKSIAVEKRLVRRSLGKVQATIATYMPQTRFDSFNLNVFETAVTEFNDLFVRLESLFTKELILLAEEKATNPDSEKQEEALFKELDDIRSAALKYKGKIKACREAASAASRDSNQFLNSSFRDSSSGTVPLKFPTIPIPKFDGNIRKFSDWKVSWESLIHCNTELNSQHKMHYLKEALIDKASTLVSDFAMLDNSYTDAWNLILKRFDNRRLIIRSLFQELTHLPAIKNESGIRDLIDKILAIVRGLKVNKINVDAMSEFLSFFLSTRLDSKTSQDFDNSIMDNQTYPKFDDLINFLQTRAFSHESRNMSDSFSTPNSSSKKSLNVTKSHTDANCPLCRSTHKLSECAKFLAKTALDRYNFAKKSHLCTNCLRGAHSVSSCSADNCHKCNLKHHTLLHRDSPVSPLDKPMVSSAPTANCAASRPEPSNSAAPVIAKTTMSTLKERPILLPTAVVFVETPTQIIKARVLLDEGSQAHLISETFLRNFGIATQKSNSSICGITNDVVTCSRLARLIIKSRFTKYSTTIEADVVAAIPYSVNRPILAQLRDRYPKLRFAESKVSSDNVDIVLGAELYNDIVNSGRQFDGDLCLKDSQFGTIVVGSVDASKFSSVAYCNLTVSRIEEQLRKFWEVEEVGVISNKSSEHSACEEHFNKTVQRLDDGRFCVRLPFKCDRSTVSNTYYLARHLFLKAESKYPPDVWKMYRDFMREYEDLGHMMPIDSPTPQPSYFIPHTAVIRQDNYQTACSL